MQGLEEILSYCPYCGESIVAEIDTSEKFQQYVEDCQVCCAPIFFTVTIDNGNIDVLLQRDDE